MYPKLSLRTELCFILLFIITNNKRKLVKCIQFFNYSLVRIYR